MFVVRRPISGDVVLMSYEEFEEYAAIPDHRGLEFAVETALECDNHACEAVIEGEKVVGLD